MNKKREAAAREIISILQKNSINPSHVIEALGRRNEDEIYSPSQLLFHLVINELRHTAGDLDDSWPQAVSESEMIRIDELIEVLDGEVK